MHSVETVLPTLDSDLLPGSPVMRGGVYILPSEPHDHEGGQPPDLEPFYSYPPLFRLQDSLQYLTYATLHQIGFALDDFAHL